MNLADNKYIPKMLIAMLEAEEWTISKLATAGPKQLTGYTGIGTVIAKRIIKEAQDMLNRAAREEFEKLTRADGPTTAELPPEDPPMSVRVRRIKEANR